MPEVGDLNVPRRLGGVSIPLTLDEEFAGTGSAFVMSLVVSLHLLPRLEIRPLLSRTPVGSQDQVRALKFCVVIHLPLTRVQSVNYLCEPNLEPFPDLRVFLNGRNFLASPQGDSS